MPIKFKLIIDTIMQVMPNIVEHTDPGIDVEFWRAKTVLARTGLSKSELYRQMAEGRFPASHSYPGMSGSFWLSTDVRNWQVAVLAKVAALDSVLG